MRKIRKYGEIFLTTILSECTYILNYFSGSLFLVLIMSIFYMLWHYVIHQTGGTIAGYSLQQMIWYLAVTETVLLSHSNIYREISREIKDGNVAYLLNKPYHYVLYQMFRSFGSISVKFLVNVSCAIVIGLVLVGVLINFSLAQLPAIVICIILGIVLNTVIYLALAVTAFYFEDNEPFFWIYSKLVFTLGGMMMPIEMFPDWLKAIAANLPFAYVTYGPARLAVQFSWQSFSHLIIIQLIYISLFFLVTMLLYKKGVRRVNVNGG